MATIGDAYQAKLREIAERYKDEFKEAFAGLEAAAKKLGLVDEYAKIMATSTNPAADLRRFAEEHGLAEEYRSAMAKLSPEVRAALSEAYSGVWTDEAVSDMRSAGEKIEKAYKFLMRGDYEGAARAAGIDVGEITGKPARDAMSIIATELGIGSAYRDIIGRRTGKRLSLKTMVEK
ncbi:MAG: hypothetical protein ACXQT3_03815 [Methermicoccaceae archaeon]